MERGAKKKPTHLKIQKGTYRKDRDVDPKKAMYVEGVTAPEPPGILDDVGKKEWIRVCGELNKLGLLAELDISLLTAYCLEISTYFECKEIIKQKTYIYVIKDDKGKTKYIQQIPHVSIGNKALTNAMQLASNFFIMPASRTKISINTKDKDENPWDDLD